MKKNIFLIALLSIFSINKCLANDTSTPTSSPSAAPASCDNTPAKYPMVAVRDVEFSLGYGRNLYQTRASVGQGQMRYVGGRFNGATEINNKTVVKIENNTYCKLNKPSDDILAKFNIGDIIVVLGKINIGSNCEKINSDGIKEVNSCMIIENCEIDPVMTQKTIACIPNTPPQRSKSDQRMNSLLLNRSQN